MKLTDQQIAVIDKYVDGSIINKERLIQYLEKHRTVKNEVFAYCSMLGKKVRFGDEAYCGLLDYKEAYAPVDRETFIRRIPFYFHCPLSSNGKGHRSGLWYVLPTRGDKLSADDLESIYQALELMYYELGLPMETIFEYCVDQVHRKRKVKKNPNKGLFLSMPDYSEDEMFGVEGDMHHKTLFPMWCHYLRLCVELGWTDYTPTRFTTRYNEALEAAGLNPIIYEPYIQYGVQHFGRRGNRYICKGHFPCDAEGKPILRWTSIRVNNAKQITFSGQRSQSGTLEIELAPNTTIHLYGYENYITDGDEPDDAWHQIYAGPLNMEFNYQALKAYRKAAGMTQKEVADAIGANVRTYQKWESKGSVPDGHYLLRIMNWLQIEDVQDLIIYTIPDEDIPLAGR